MKLLALDTSTEACSVALLDGAHVEERFAIVQQSHSQHILKMVAEVLAAGQVALAQLDALAFGRGPGSFTGLRICAGVAQGLAYGADLPVVPVSSLAALAQAENAERVLAALDARMNQVYWGVYERRQGLVALCGEEQVVSPEAVPVPAGTGWVGAGSGWDHYESALRVRFGDAITEVRKGRYPRASAVAVLGRAAISRGEAVPAEQAIPVYVRDDVAKKSAR